MVCVPSVTPWIRQWFCLLKAGFPLTSDPEIWRRHKKHEICMAVFSGHLFLEAVLQQQGSPPCPSDGFLHQCTCIQTHHDLKESQKCYLI